MPALSPRLLVMLLGLTATSGAALADPVPATAPVAPPSVSLPPRMTAPDYRMGNPKAKVTVVEYASDTCPHCAHMAEAVFPEFKKKYVDTGKVLYVFREFPTDPAQVSVAGFIVARCAGEPRYFDVVNALFKAQTTAKSGLEFLMAGAKVGGLSEDQVKACLEDQAAISEFNARIQAAVDVQKIDSTPTFIINGKKVELGETPMKDLTAAIEPLLGPTKEKAVQNRRGA